MRIGFDLDNCGYPLAVECQEYFSRRLGTQLPLETHWDSHTLHWGLSKETYQQLLNEGVEDGELFANADPIPGFQEATWAISEMGHEVVIATARGWRVEHNTGRRVTREWLQRNRVLYDDLKFVRDKRDAGADIFIDDKPTTVPLLILAGVDAVYYDRPWNQGFPYPRVHSWEEFVKYVEERS